MPIYPPKLSNDLFLVTTFFCVSATKMKKIDTFQTFFFLVDQQIRGPQVENRWYNL